MVVSALHHRDGPSHSNERQGLSEKSTGGRALGCRLSVGDGGGLTYHPSSVDRFTSLDSLHEPARRTAAARAESPSSGSHRARDCRDRALGGGRSPAPPLLAG